MTRPRRVARRGRWWLVGVSASPAWPAGFRTSDEQFARLVAAEPDKIDPLPTFRPQLVWPDCDHDTATLTAFTGPVRTIRLCHCHLPARTG